MNPKLLQRALMIVILFIIITGCGVIIITPKGPQPDPGPWPYARLMLAIGITQVITGVIGAIALNRAAKSNLSR